MFAIAGVTGHTGRIVAERLLAAGRKVRAIARDTSKAKKLGEAGAELFAADVLDEAAFSKAFTGAEGAYVLLPPDPSSTDSIGRGHKIAKLLASAIRAAKVPHVVLLSSIGAQHETGTGPIKMLHFTEKLFRSIEGTRFTFLRASYFMENHLVNLKPMKESGVLPVFGGGETYPFAQVATKDIGETAAEALLHPPSVTQVVELEGPAARSLNEAAAVFGEVLGRSVKATPMPLEGLIPALTSFGYTADGAGQYREMIEGMGKGLLAFEGGSARHLRGKVTLEEFARAAVAK